ncbi:MAG: hypothetical protein CMB67_05090, partial [Euryarchaeota archaeon]|nr:hypothetical protein [Euryarchaeota archaeon]
WMRDQKKSGDGLKFMQWLYKPGILRRSLWPLVRIGMLRKKELTDGRIVHRMPFRRSLKRDVWEQSQRAYEINEQWKSKQKEGSSLSFGEEDA